MRAEDIVQIFVAVSIAGIFIYYLYEMHRQDKEYKDLMK
jgi:hypothetical protein